MATEPTTEIVVRDDPEQSRYEVYDGPTRAGFATYHSQPDLVTVLHTEIKTAFEGQGVGSELVRQMLDDIRSKGAHVLPVCPFVLAFLRRHPEYHDLVWNA
jgi:predicted GNAT family acetyltransferase